MDWKELLGFIGGLLTTGAYVPQVWRLYKIKSAKEISLTFTLMLLVGIILWLAYGLSFGLRSVVLWNAVTLVLGCSMLYAKLKYGK